MNAPSVLPQTYRASVVPILDRWTIGAIAVIAYASANVLHEGLGHGGACLLLGVKPSELNAIFLQYPSSGTPSVATRLIAAAGGIVNLGAGLLALAGASAKGTRPNSWHYFLWLFAAVNLLMAFGYPLFSGAFGAGDWIAVTQGIAPALVTRVGLVAIGGVLYFVVAPRLLFPRFASWLGADAPSAPQLQRLLRLPYFVGGTLFVLAGLLNPYGWKLIVISAAAASFGGTSLLVSYKFRAIAAGPAAPLQIARNYAWIIAAVLIAAIFVGILGRGIKF